jgi:hypothetical protein
MDEPPRRADLWKPSMDVWWPFDCAAEIEKLTSLYAKSKRLHRDAERDIDPTQPIDPSKPIVDEVRFGFDRIPFLQRLGSTRPGALPSFRDLMMPALVRVGAVTERTRARSAEGGIHVDDATPILESLEGRETREVTPQGERPAQPPPQASDARAERTSGPSG